MSGSNEASLDDVVGRLDDVEIMLDHEQGAPCLSGCFSKPPSCSVRAWRALRFRRICASSSVSSPARRPVRAAWPRVARPDGFACPRSLRGTPGSSPTKACRGRQNSPSFGTSRAVPPRLRLGSGIPEPSVFRRFPSNCTSLRVPNARAAGHGHGAAFLQRWPWSPLTRWTIAEQPMTTR
jgi:hypothetical protein